MRYRVVHEGRDVTVSQQQFARLRMLADWQLRHLGYSPSSITSAALACDEAIIDESDWDYPVKG